MHTHGFTELAAPASREHFVDTMVSVCRDAGAGRFLVVRLGPDLAEVVHVVHNGGPAGEARLGEPLHWSVERMLDTMREAVPPRVFGDAAHPGIEVPGYAYGVAAIARERLGACVTYLGLEAPASGDEVVSRLMATAQMCAQMGLLGLVREPRPCPLSKQELDCLRYFAANANAKDTARALGLSARTIEAHLARARIRCGVDSSLAVAMVALNEGWIEWPEVRAISHG